VSVEAAGARLSDEGPRGVQGQYHYDVAAVSRLRFVGASLLFLVVALHNGLVSGGLDSATFFPALVGAEIYCLVAWRTLRAFSGRASPVDLGFVFLATDFLLFDLALWVSGGHVSLLWPIFVLRTADQVWVDHGRAKVMAVMGPIAYAGLIAYQAFGEGQEVSWGAEATKLTVLVSMNAFLMLIAAAPWRQQQRTQHSKEVILRLEKDSAKLEEARRQAEEALRSKGEFLGRMSHQLRTPLNSVLGFTNVLLKNKKNELGDRDLDFLERIQYNGIHLLNLVNDLLDLNRIEAGEMTVELTDLDLGSLIEETVGQLDDWGSEEGVETRVSVPPDLDPVRGDESRLRQVLVNLIENAVKFTEEGSITVRVEAEGSTVRKISVEDTGIGVPPERIKTIFMPFEQADGGKTRAHQGSGLGLAISSALCEMMEMQLTVESVLGEGSTFTIALTPPA
jgi:signal transduction histidine kinase